MFGVFKQIFIGLFSSIVNASNNTKCVSLNNQVMNKVKNYTTVHLWLN